MTPRIGITGVLRQWDGAERTGVNAAYARSVVQAGGVPMILPPFIPPEHAEAALDGLDGVVLTGGEDVDPALYGAERSPLIGTVSPERDQFERALVAAARARSIPLLGICRGIQLINVALGGTLWQDLPSEHPGGVDHDPGSGRDARTHAIRVLDGSRTAAVLGSTSFSANSFHHQAVRDLAPGLVASAWTADELIEAVESANGDWWLLAVQWHPEEMHAECAAPDHGLFRSLVEEAAATHSRR